MTTMTFVFIFFGLLAVLSKGGTAIDCYHCTSIAGSNLACEDEFRQDLSTVHMIARDCHYGYFLASHCYKLKGVREDGTHFIVRHCSDADWGSNCGDIRYLFEDKEERIQGCLTTCKYDGCNKALSIHRPSLFLMGVVLVTCLFRHLQTLLGVF